jgi:uncharacterized membrane protein YkvA (DUF1232 family)
MISVNNYFQPFGRVLRKRPPTNQGIPSIPEYIDERAALLTPADIEKLRTKLPLLKVRFAAIQAPEFPHLRQQLDLLADFFEDICDGVFPAGSEAVRNQTAFVLLYATKGADIIPDIIPEIGYADDSLIARVVLTRHQEVFQKYCRFRKIRWSKSLIAP